MSVLDAGAPVWLKVCCIQSVEEARLAAEAGAAAIGLVSRMPSGPGVIDEATIAEVVRRAPPGVARVLLTCETDAEAIVGQQRRTGADTLQLVDAVPVEHLRALRAELPGVRLLQVIHVRDQGALDEAAAAEPHVDGLLLDSGDPTQATKVLGGTGRVHDWAVSRELCARARVPVLLAGGLRPDNAAEAVARVTPAGLDVCSGLRTDGRLDAEKLRRFVAAVRLRAAPLFAR